MDSTFIIIPNDLQIFLNTKSRNFIKLAILIIENLRVVTLSPTQNFSSPKRKRREKELSIEFNIRYILFKVTNL